MKGVTLAVALGVGLGTGPAHAILVELGPEQIKAAVAQGAASYERLRRERQPADNLDPEYVVDLGPDAGEVYFFTEFGTLALEARRYLAIGQQIKDEAIARVTEASRGKLVFQVAIVGPKRDFLRHYRVALVQGDRSHLPLQADVYRGVPVPGSSERHRSPAVYTFASKDVDPTAPAALVLSDGAGRELRFEFDLSRLR